MPIRELCGTSTAYGACAKELKTFSSPFKCEFEIMMFIDQQCNDNLFSYGIAARMTTQGVFKKRPNF
jgi:hypothetical protein